MTCATCSAPCSMLDHNFHCDVPHREDWVVTAPLYYLAAPDFRSAVAGFCSAVCSTRWHYPAVARG